MKLLVLTDTELADLLDAIDSHIEFPRDDLEPDERKEMVARYKTLENKLRVVPTEEDGEKCGTCGGDDFDVHYVCAKAERCKKTAVCPACARAVPLDAAPLAVCGCGTVFSA